MCCNYLQSVKKALKGKTQVHLIDSLLLFEMLLLFIGKVYCPEGIYDRRIELNRVRDLHTFELAI